MNDFNSNDNKFNDNNSNDNLSTEVVRLVSRKLKKLIMYNNGDDKLHCEFKVRRRHIQWNHSDYILGKSRVFIKERVEINGMWVS